MKNVVLLLTGCVNPQNMAFTKLNDADERKRQYINAIQFYLSKMRNPIVFCENSGTDISGPFAEQIKKREIEFLSFCGNIDKTRGKGFGEAEIIEHALTHSLFINDSSVIVKITGRLIVENISNIIKQFPVKKNFVTCLFHSDLKFADSRIFCATKFFFQEFLANKEQINDQKKIYFEHVLASTVIASKVSFIPFTEEPAIFGVSGTSGETYEGSLMDIQHNIHYKQYALRQLLMVCKNSPNRELSIFQKITTKIRIVGYHFFSRIEDYKKRFG